MKFLHMPKEPKYLKWLGEGVNGFKSLGIVTLAPNGEEFPRRCGQEDRAVNEAWEEQGPTKWRCDLAWGIP